MPRSTVLRGVDKNGLELSPLQPERPPRVLCDEVVRKIAQQLEAYSEEGDRHFLELKFILNRDESDYAG